MLEVILETLQLLLKLNVHLSPEVAKMAEKLNKTYEQHKVESTPPMPPPSEPPKI